MASILPSSRYAISSGPSFATTPDHSLTSSDRPTSNRRQAWELSSTSSTAIAVSATAAILSRNAVITTPPNNALARSAIGSVAVMTHNEVPSKIATPLSPILPKPLSAVAFENVHLLSIITEYAPNLALPLICKAFNPVAKMALAQVVLQKYLQPNGLEKAIPLVNNLPEPLPYISSDLDKYYKEMLAKHLEAKTELLTCEDYTPACLMVNMPLDFLPATFKELPLLYVDWSAAEIEQRKAKLKRSREEPIPPGVFNLKNDALEKISYFLSESYAITNALLGKRGTLYSESVGLKIYLAENAQFLSQLFRYVFDQIRYSTNSHLKLLSIAKKLFENHCDKYLSYADLHYSLLILIQVTLTRNFMNVEEQFEHVALIKAMLTEIKLKKPDDLKDLKEHLQIFLSPDLQAKREAAQLSDNRANLVIQGIHFRGQHAYAEIIKVVKSHFRGFTDECCIIA